MTGAALSTLLQAIFLAGCGLTAGKLFVTGLYRRYPVFFLYFLFRIPVTIWTFSADLHSFSYFSIWKTDTALALIFYVLLVVELYRLVLERYRGVQTGGGWAMFASGGISCSISLLTFLPGMALLSLPSRTYRLFLAVERAVDTALALFIILLLAFL